MNKSKIFAAVAEIAKERDQKVELSKGQIELGVGQDIQKMLAKVQKAMEKLGDIEDKAKSTFNSFEDKLADVYGKALDAMDKLFDQHDKVSVNASEVKSIIDKANDAAKDLGLSPNDIKGYSQLKEIIDDFQSVAKMSRNEIGKIQDIKL